MLTALICFPLYLPFPALVSLLAARLPPIAQFVRGLARLYILPTVTPDLTICESLMGGGDSKAQVQQRVKRKLKAAVEVQGRNKGMGEWVGWVPA